VGTDYYHSCTGLGKNPDAVSFQQGGVKARLMQIYRFLIKNPISLLIVILLISGIFVAYLQHQNGIAIALTTSTILTFVLLYLYSRHNKPQAKPSLNDLEHHKEQLEKSIHEHKSALDKKNEELEQVEQNLKEVQHQLMIQEKMASVGLLAAGIAHEIKNPLNFINNFSDMTVELMDELKEELVKPLESVNDETKQVVNSIIEDIVTNCKKINEHGKRAESIIKNMLIQARTSEVEKSLIDINSLLEEYLNLSYHGMRAQNNQLNIKIEKNLDKTIQPILADQQSIGRVFLNIINNGLYAANEKSKVKNVDFMPTITILTSQDENNVIIKIKDNGNGIPESIRAKIFEPFFTTKPAGQGTGLGLPICYDIVVTEHNGKLEIESTPGEFTEFIITLPKK